MDALSLQMINGGHAVPTVRAPADMRVSVPGVSAEIPAVTSSCEPETGWIARMANGDEAALGELYERFVSHVFGLALRITHDTCLAEEVVSDTFLQAWRTATSFDPDRGKPIAWLLTITRSRSLDAIRRVDRATPVADPHELMGQQKGASPEFSVSGQWVGSQSADPADQLAHVDRDRQLRLALDRLSAVQRQLIALAFFQGLSHNEIAHHINMPLGTVKSHLRRGQEQLKTLLAGKSVRREAS